jgi:predicted hotdog family 3-hydroxylacyl-ACP dehydratase
MHIQGEDIKRLIPQRAPFMMVDEFESGDDNHAVTRLTIAKDNYFMLTDGTMATTGLIEHMAQSCSALAGSRSDSTSPIGMIAEIKHFLCSRRPEAEETLQTEVAFNMTFGQMTLAHCTCTSKGETIAEVDLKIFMQ